MSESRSAPLPESVSPLNWIPRGVPESRKRDIPPPRALTDVFCPRHFSTCAQAMTVQTCEQCGREFPAQLVTARYCSGACRAAASRARRGMSSPDVLPHPSELHVGPVTEAVLATYGDDVTEHWLGAVTVLLAKHLDSDAVPGRAMVALSREFRAYLSLLNEKHRGSPQ